METLRRPERRAVFPGFAPIPQLDQAAYERLAGEVSLLLGIDLNHYKPAQVWRRVNGFAAARGLPGADELVARARHDAALRQAFLDMLTINVSEFFRNPEAWDTLTEQFLRPMLRTQESVRIWSAGCSQGSEPFSIAMIVHELAPATPARIVATDVDETILSRARKAVYTETQMAGISAARRARFFSSVPEGWEVRPEIRSLVAFRRHDLLADRCDGTFDIIVCRNVVIYFTEAAKADLLARFVNSLRPGGVLFMGATESILNARALGLVPLGGTFYQRPDAPVPVR
jgi:chemotaxis protein methyltransferase CheR